MESLFDKFISLPYLFFISVILIIIIFVFIGVKFSPFKSKTANNIFLIGMIFLPFISLFIIPYNRLGMVENVTEMFISQRKICFIDHRTSKNKLGARNYYRLHIIDPENGKRIYRIFLGEEVKLLGHKKDLIFYENNKGYCLFDIDSLKVRKNLSIEYLESRFSALKCGIQQIYQYDSMILIQSKDGKDYYYNQWEDKITDSIAAQTDRLADYSISYKAILTNDTACKKFAVLEGKDDYDKLRQLRYCPHYAGENNIVQSNETYLNGRFIGFFPDNKNIIILSYETTDCLDYFITAIDSKGKTIWRINQSGIGAKDIYLSKPTFGKSVVFKNHIIFSTGGFLISVHSVTGKIDWKGRY